MSAKPMFVPRIVNDAPIERPRRLRRAYGERQAKPGNCECCEKHVPELIAMIGKFPRDTIMACLTCFLKEVESKEFA
jgi:hypothetical protein